MKNVRLEVSIIVVLVLVIVALCVLSPSTVGPALWRVVECNMPGVVCVKPIP